MTQPRVDAEVALEVASHEALIRQTYKDSVGVLTWCVGMTNATGHRVERYIGKPASLQHCMNLYAWALDNYAEGVYRAFRGYPLTKAQFTAAMSFNWNTGAIERASWVDLWKVGRIAEARKAFMDWDIPSEIIPRRQKECDLFFDGKWSTNGTMIEYTRVTSRMTPVWSSAKRINVAKELRAAFGKTPVQGVKTPVQVDQPPKPDAPVETPTISPNPSPAGLLAFAVIGAFVAAGTWIWSRIRKS